MSHPTRVLLVCPRFSADSFWVYTPACEIVGAKYPTAPLGLITIAAMLPQTWEFRFINRNTETLEESDVAWADMVLTGGMLFQQADSLRIIELAHKHGKPTAVGGPDVTSHAYIYEASDFKILGEAEGVIDDFVKAWEAGERKGVFEAEKFQADVTKTPIPRFDLLKFDQYLYIGVQFSRGCPFTCEFCDIIELYGRVPRTKTTPQMLAELDRLYELGYRGHVDFVDDNLIGNKKAVKAFLPHLAQWIKEHDYPFEFSTEASLNLADDVELLALMRDANFFGLFVGIESPDEETLRQMRKKQNTRRNIADGVHAINQHGMFVFAGFIVGFDAEKGSVAGPMIELIENCAIPIAMVGLLYGLSNTQLGRRLKKEGRLHPGSDMQETGSGDQCTAGLNFDTLRPRAEILSDYRNILEHTYDPAVFAGRLKRLSDLLDRTRSRRDAPAGDLKLKAGTIETVYRIVNKLPEAREPLWEAFTYCAKTNPAGLRFIVNLMAIYLHVGPFSRRVMADIDRQIASSNYPVIANSQLPQNVQVALSA
jgi:Domain of unknown function (DUF4070)/Radical SAM superfamily